jgi:hypothetical protein
LNPALTREKAEETQKVVEGTDAQGLHRRVAAERLGITYDALRHRVAKCRDKFNMNIPRHVPNKKPTSPEFPEFSAEEGPIEEVLDRLEKQGDRKRTRHREQQWFPIKMPDDLPFGQCFFGDPHISSQGCNIKLLREHCDICAKTEGLYGVNIGDTVDHWPVNSARLARLWAETDISLQTEWRLVRWFFHESGVDWLIWLLGNHDTFNTNSKAMFKELARNVVPVMDAEAKYVITTPNGSVFPVWARHDFKGHSQFNTLHAAMRNMRERADVERGCHLMGIEGHKHNWAIHEEENADRGYLFTIARARGYKYVDDHAMHLGFSEQEYGASILYVCNPQAKNLAQMTTVWKDVAEGAEYLTWLRKRFK